MKKINGAASAATETTPRTAQPAKGCDPIKNVTQSAPFVKFGRTRAEQLRRLHFAHDISGPDIVQTVQQIAPKFGKSELSKAENPESYGIEISADALKALWLTYAPDEYELMKRSGDGHRLTKRLYCRVEDDLYEDVISFISSERMDVNRFLNILIRDFFRIGGTT